MLDDGQFLKGPEQPDPEEVLKYWTPERMRDAKPEPMRLVPGPEQAEASKTRSLAAVTTTRVRDLHTYPYNAVGRLYYSRGANTWSCTATIIASNIILTAAHCMYDQNTKKWASNINFVPSYAPGSSADTFAAVGPPIIPKIWEDGGGHQFDYAMVRVQGDMLVKYQKLVLAVGRVPDTTPYHSIGYPRRAIPGYDFDGEHMWECVGASSGLKQGLLTMENNMTEGCSGGPWLSESDAGQTVRSVFGLNSAIDLDRSATVVSPYFDIKVLQMYQAVTKIDFTTVWERSLPDCGYQIVSPLYANGKLYAGSNGHVYTLDPKTGDVLRHNNLPSRGRHEIRLAADQEKLYVGTSGYALGLNLSDLSTSWEKSLPGCGYDIVSMLCANGKVYAGSYGYAYELDPKTGNVLRRSSLHDPGSNEIRLAADQQKLYVATNGHAIGLNFTDFSVAWKTSLPGCGYDIVSILYADGKLYAGSNGHVYELDTKSGNVLRHNSLPDRGRHEIRLAADKERLYAGTNSHGIALQRSDLATKWQRKLPDGGNVVSVLCVDDHVFFGTDGYAYHVHPSEGQILNVNSLPGRGNNEVRLTVSDARLILGINGYILGID